MDLKTKIFPLIESLFLDLLKNSQKMLKIDILPKMFKINKFWQKILTLVSNFGKKRLKIIYFYTFAYGFSKKRDFFVFFQKCCVPYGIPKRESFFTFFAKNVQKLMNIENILIFEIMPYKLDILPEMSCF